MDKIKDKKKTLLKYILKKFFQEIRFLLKANKSQSQEILIEKLSSLIRQWWFIFNSPPFYNCFIPRSFFPSLLPCTSLKLYACVFFSYSFYFPLLKDEKIRFVKNKKKSWFSGLGTLLVLFPKSASSRAETSLTRFFLEPSVFLKGVTFNPDSIIGRKNYKGSLDPFFLALGGYFIKEPIQLRTNVLKLKKEGFKKKVLLKKEQEKNQWEVLLALPFFTNKLKWLNILYVLPTGFLFFSFLPLNPQISVAHKGLFCPFLFIKKPLLLRKTLVQTATSLFCNNQRVLQKIKKQSFLEKKKKKSLSFSSPLKIKKLLFFLPRLRPRLYSTPSFLPKKRKSTIKAFLGFRVSSDLSSFDFFTNVQNLNQTKNIEKEKRSSEPINKKKENKEKIDALYKVLIRGESFPLPFSSYFLASSLALLRRTPSCFLLLSYLRTGSKRQQEARDRTKPGGEGKQAKQKAKKLFNKNNQENNKRREEKRNFQIRDFHFSLFLKNIKNYSDATLLKIVWKWTYKRHSKKSNKWLIKQYFVKLNGQNKVFSVLLPRKKSQKRTIKKLVSCKKKAFISLALLWFRTLREKKQPCLFSSKRVKKLSQQKLEINTLYGNSNKPVIKNQGLNKSLFYQTAKYPWPIEKKFPILKKNLLKNVYKKGTFFITLLKKKSLLRFFFHFLRSKKKGLIRKRKENLLRSKFFSKVKKKCENPLLSFEEPFLSFPPYCFTRTGRSNSFSVASSCPLLPGGLRSLLLPVVLRSLLLPVGTKDNRKKQGIQDSKKGFFEGRERRETGTNPKNKKFFPPSQREFFTFLFSKTRKNNKIIGKRRVKKEKKEGQLRKTTLHYFNNSKNLFFRNSNLKKKKTRFNLFFTIPTSRELDITYHKNIRKKYSQKKICDQSNDFLYWSYQKTKIRSI